MIAILANPEVQKVAKIEIINLFLLDEIIDG
jgi:hypothetical protein